MSTSDRRHISTMPDDCFLQIFKHLHWMDLFAVRGTCKRFRNISEYIFERSIGSFKLEGRDVGSAHLLTLKDGKNYIRNFGKFMTKLSIDGKHFGELDDPSKLVPLLDRYCHALRDLEFVNVELEAATVTECDRLFSNLNRLVIDDIKNKETLTRLVAYWKTLKELKIKKCKGLDEFLVPESTSLESFTMTLCWGPTPGFFPQFFAKNHQLKRVIIMNNLLRVNLLEISEFEFLSIDLPNLESLSLDCYSTFFQIVVPHIPSLKKVELLTRCTTVPITRVLTDLAVRNHIEDLHLADTSFDDDLVRNLCAMKTLQILKLSKVFGLDGNNCKKLAGELPVLSELHMNRCADTTFNDIEVFVRHSNSLKKIVFNRNDSQQPSLSEVTVSSLVEARQRKQALDTLIVFLNDNDLRDIQIGFERNGMPKKLSLIHQSRVIKLLPLKTEHMCIGW